MTLKEKIQYIFQIVFESLDKIIMWLKNRVFYKKKYYA